ncbi:MAG: DndE family protein [Candidatus Methanofastidiosa archaeon]|jgi:DNA sulfur modification protein DndE|nr:DndE family protein [Candidatus Methanofastidiosa archaeon]
MQSKLKLSKGSSFKLDSLSSKLNLRRNIICRLAIGRSLVDNSSVIEIEPLDNNGFEFNRYTLTGEHDNFFKLLIVQHEGKKMDDDLYFSKYLRNHIERGIEILYDEYQRINSPTEFLLFLSSISEENPK